MVVKEVVPVGDPIHGVILFYVQVHSHDAADLAGTHPDVGVGPLFPPSFDDLLVFGGVIQSLRCTGVLTGATTVRLATGADPCFD
jgi:hypothetical protein